MKTESTRFRFIGHALNGDGPFRPVITYNAYDKPSNVNYSYLIKYPRESDEKFARRCELAFYASPLAKVTNAFVSHVASKPVSREVSNEILALVMDDVDGKNNSVDVFWQEFMLNAKARGSLLLLVDMPNQIPQTQLEQIANRVAPYWTYILPENVTDYQVNDYGKFDYVEFSGTYTKENGEKVDCVWHFDAEMWEARDNDDKVLTSGEHPLRECPVISFTEMGDYPNVGPFAPIADLSKRLYNLDSELDEILRSQTFSLLTMQVPDNTSGEERLEAARIAGETIGTNNLLMHGGSTPAFIAPPDGPASIYLERIRDIRDQISDIGLEVTQINQQESGIAMQMRFHTINAELAKFCGRMEDLERRAWELTARWLGINELPEIEWPRDFNLADTEQELQILRDMQETAMSPAVVMEQQKKVIETQFSGMDRDQLEDLTNSLNNDLSQTDG